MVRGIFLKQSTTTDHHSEGFFCKTQPLMPPRMFKNIGFVAITTLATLGAMVYYSLTVLWPTIISTVYTTNVTEVGWQSSVVGGGILLGQSIAGISISYVPKVKYQCIIASGLAFAFMTSLTTISIDRWAATIALGVLTCASIGFVENISFPGVTLIWEPQDIGLATGVLGSIRGFGGAIAQSLYVSVLNNQLVKKIPEHVIPAAKAAGLPESSMDQLLAGTSTGDFSSVPGITDSILSSVAAAMKDAYVGSYKIVFYTTIPFSVILFLMAFLVPNMEKFLGNNVAKKLQRHH